MIVEGSKLNETLVSLNDKDNNSYMFDIIIKTENNVGSKFTFYDKLQIHINDNKIIYKNSYQNYSNEPIISTTKLSDLGVIIKNYFNLLKTSI